MIAINCVHICRFFLMIVTKLKDSIGYCIARMYMHVVQKKSLLINGI